MRFCCVRCKRVSCSWKLSMLWATTDRESDHLANSFHGVVIRKLFGNPGRQLTLTEHRNTAASSYASVYYKGLRSQLEAGLLWSGRTGRWECPGRGRRVDGSNRGCRRVAYGVIVEFVDGLSDGRRRRSWRRRLQRHKNCNHVSIKKKQSSAKLTINAMNKFLMEALTALFWLNPREGGALWSPFWLAAAVFTLTNGSSSTAPFW